MTHTHPQCQNLPISLNTILENPIHLLNINKDQSMQIKQYFAFIKDATHTSMQPDQSTSTVITVNMILHRQKYDTRLNRN